MARVHALGVVSGTRRGLRPRSLGHARLRVRLDGLAELDGRRLPMLEWYEMLDAPTKQLITFEDAAHSVAFEQADEVQRLLNETIVPTTYGR